jgi:hypothetical protein
MKESLPINDIIFKLNIKYIKFTKLTIKIF